MTCLGILLLAIGLADLAAGGLVGEPASRRRWSLAVAAAAVTAAAAAWAAAIGPGAGVGVTLLAVAASGGWMHARLGRPLGRRRAGWALAILTGALVAAVASGVPAASTVSPLARWLAGLDLPRLHSLAAAPGRFLLLAGCIAALAGSGNAAVRAMLAAAGTAVERPQQILRGGRAVGILERWLIFGLALAGEPTAAALVISAKGILRFPELARVARASQPATGGDDAALEPVDVVTEYFLLGSLASWGLALGAAALAAG